MCLRPILGTTPAVKEFIKAGTTVCKAIVTKKAVTESAGIPEVGGATESSLFNSILGSL